MSQSKLALDLRQHRPGVRYPRLVRARDGSADAQYPPTAGSNLSPERTVVVGRAFGDEFLVLAPYAHAQTVANRIAEGLGKPRQLPTVCRWTSVAPIGIALRPDHGMDPVTPGTGRARSGAYGEAGRRHRRGV